MSLRPKTKTAMVWATRRKNNKSNNSTRCLVMDLFLGRSCLRACWWRLALSTHTREFSLDVMWQSKWATNLGLKCYMKTWTPVRLWTKSPTTKTRLENWSSCKGRTKPRNRNAGRSRWEGKKSWCNTTRPKDPNLKEISPLSNNTAITNLSQTTIMGTSLWVGLYPSLTTTLVSPPITPPSDSPIKCPISYNFIIFAHKYKNP